MEVIVVPSHLRSAFIERLGKLPAMVAPDPVVLQRVEVEDHVRETIELSTSPDVRLRAHLLIPRGLTSKAAGILAVHQHNGEYHLGKCEPAGIAGNPDLAYGVELCRRGHVIIVPDLDGF